jgi:PAS domain S-box-containing protein
MSKRETGALAALDSFRRVSRELNTTLDLHRVLAVVLEESMRLCSVPYGAILICEIGRGELDLAAAAGYTTQERQRILRVLQEPRSHPVLEIALRTQQALTYSNLALVTDGPQESTARFARRAASVLVIPIFYAGTLTGLIVLEDAETDTFNQELVEFIEGMADQAAIAVGNAIRYQEQLERGELLRQRAEQLASVLEVGRALRSDRPLEDMLEEVAYGIQESVGFDLVLISLAEGDPPHQRRVVAAGIPLPTLERMRDVRQPWSLVERVMDDRFRVSQSYYVPAERRPAWFDQLDTYASQRSYLEQGSELQAEALEGPVAGERGVVRKPGRWHPSDIFLVPLIGSGDDVQGVISVDQPRDGRVPDRGTIEALEVFAAQAALAIENARMVEMLQRRAEVLSLFNEISQSATAKLDLNAVLDDVVATAPRLLPCDLGVIFLFDVQSGNYVPRAVHGSSFAEISALAFAPSEGLVGEVAETGLPLTVDAAEQYSSTLFGSEVSVRTAALAPLTVGGQVVGVLCVARENADDFSPAEVAMLSALADQVSVAVDNARLFEEVRSFSAELERRVEERTHALAEAMEELREERDRVEALYRITAQLAASLDLDHVLNKALMLIVDAVGAERASTLILDLGSGQLIHRAGLGEDVKLPPGGRPACLSGGEDLVHWVMGQRQATVVPDIGQDPRWREGEDEGGEDYLRGYRSALAVPLVATDQVLGALLLLHSSVGYFRAEHVRLIETAAAQIAQSINNVGLYNVIGGQAERLGNMLKVQQVESAKSQAILEDIADGVMVTDVEGKVILFNAASERILGLPRQRALGRTTSEMLGLYGSQALDWMEAVDGWAEHPGSYADGDYLSAQLSIEGRVVSVNLAPVLMGGANRPQEFLGTVSVFRDVTAEVEADRAKTEFVSMVSHELRTPMTSIKGYADLLLMRSVGSLTEDQERFLSIIGNNVDRLTMLVDDLLDISRIESGRLDLHLEPMNLEEAVERVISSMKARADQRDLLLQSEMPVGGLSLPMVYADPDRVVQILTNLVANACQYTPAGGRVVVSARAVGNKVHVSVRDTGIGISPENQEKIFERFFRADDPVVRSSSGTGLGLPIVSSLVEMHGEEIWLESKLGEGSIFTFTLPILGGQAADVPEPRSKRILVVEDDPDVARLIQIHLSGEHREVLIAHRGEDALEIARREDLDLITLDIMLPDMNGFDLLDTLKADSATRDTPVIIVSVVSDRHEGLRLGAVDYITKPIDEERLLTSVRKVLVARDGSVLVVDDDRDTLLLLSKVLATHNFTVHTATRGREALSVAREVRPSLILLDLKLPDLDGYTVLEQLKGDATLSSTPVIVMTGSEIINDARRQKVLALGAERFISKPFSVEALVEQIEMAS